MRPLAVHVVVSSCCRLCQGLDSVVFCPLRSLHLFCYDWTARTGMASQTISWILHHCGLWISWSEIDHAPWSCWRMDALLFGLSCLSTRPQSFVSGHANHGHWFSGLHPFAALGLSSRVLLISSWAGLLTSTKLLSSTSEIVENPRRSNSDSAQNLKWWTKQVAIFDPSSVLAIYCAPYRLVTKALSLELVRH